MSTMLDWSLWKPSFVTVALGATLIFLGALVVQRWVKSMTWRRTLWQIAFLSVGLLALAQFSGTDRLAMNWMQKPAPVQDNITTLVETKVIGEPDPNLLAAARLHSLEPTTINPSLAVAESPAVWWPTAIWLAGVGVMLGWIILLRFGFWALVRRRIVRDEALLARVDGIARRIGLSQQICVTEVCRLATPIAHGILRPGISLPEGFASRHSTGQQEVMLAHELAHLAARDPLWHTLVDIVMSLVWWHPLAWLARHELRAATEAAADEACLVVENGPTTLAECLVDLGSRISHRRAISGLGMEGGGFRSGLGKRVKRLLATENRTWNPPAPHRLSLTRIIAPLAMAALILVTTVWAQPTATGPATLHDAFQQSLLGVLLTTALPTPQQSTEATNQTAEVLPSPAPPKNTTEYFIQAGDTLSRLVSTIREQGRPMTLKTLQEANPGVQWNRLRIGQRIVIPEVKTASNDDRRKVLNQKLDSILIEEIEFDGETLNQAIDKLARVAKDRDPAGTGINFVITTQNPSPRPGTTGNANVVVTPEAKDSFINLLRPLKGVTIREALREILRSASVPLTHQVEDYAVIISAKPPEPLALYTRFFRIDQNAFERALVSVAKIDLEQAISNAVRVSPLINLPPSKNEPKPSDAKRVTQGPTRAEMFLADTRRYFAQLGVDFSAPGRQLVYSDRKGQLMTRATLEELDIIEQAIGVLTASPPQVTIEASVYEITTEDAHALGLDRFLGNEFTNLLKAASTQKTNFHVAGILTDPQRRVVLRAMDQSGLTNLLNAPKMTMLSGRPGQFKQVRVRYIVTDLDWSSTITSLTNPPQAQPIAEPFELGPVIDVIPYVQADGKTIELTTIPTVTEFEGYDLDNRDRREIVTMPDGRKEIVMVPDQPLPIFRKRQIVSSATVKDGHTLVLAGGSDQFLINLSKNTALFTGKKPPSKSGPTHLLILVTPTLIDPAGNRFNPAE